MLSKLIIDHAVKSFDRAKWQNYLVTNENDIYQIVSSSFTKTMRSYSLNLFQFLKLNCLPYCHYLRKVKLMKAFWVNFCKQNNHGEEVNGCYEHKILLLLFFVFLQNFKWDVVLPCVVDDHGS